ncbi:LytR C-terminal domain-containing protein [Arthrobacter sp. ISL-28]|uniref:LytR C-terminal domain-containing protein n=1 Tax=Arthrobacter sp. ISL-28 TaxID=2819108 RepID=UPI001BE72BFC|nr:LytR C-terminal domain-containing protein [Arthrobacter sp. ISL-28]MBT2520952.1 LytR C-terminal domain-containing protein [Arthrobacter sp. ISL-28]
MTNYARDEFDRVPEATSRQGVHRAPAAAARPRLWPILSVGIGALVVGLAAFLLLPQLGFEKAVSPFSAKAEAAAPSESSARPSVTPSAAESSGAAEAEKPSETPSASESASPSTTAPGAIEEFGSAVDKTLPVSVYNGTLTSGLAGRVGATVEADGWVLGEVANWQGAPQKQSVIFYSDAAHRASAEALGDLLNITTFVESAEFQTPFAVVLGPGYE